MIPHPNMPRCTAWWRGIDLGRSRFAYSWSCGEGCSDLESHSHHFKPDTPSKLFQLRCAPILVWVDLMDGSNCNEVNCTLFFGYGIPGHPLQAPFIRREIWGHGTEPLHQVHPRVQEGDRRLRDRLGKPITECCQELGLNAKTVKEWVIKRRREVVGKPDPRAASSKVRALRKRVHELERENEFLKKAAAFFARTQG